MSTMMKDGKELAPHQQRVVAEQNELDEKIAKLHAFCFGDNDKIFKTLSPEERDRLEDQYTIMVRYSAILGKRIAAF